MEGLPDVLPIGRDGAAALREFAHPIWSEVFDHMVRGGRDESEHIFDEWLSVTALQGMMDDGYVFGYFAPDGDTVGFLALRVEKERLFISKCYLQSDMRGRGYGSRMLQEMISYGREHGCTSAYLHVNWRNERAIRAYERNGFTVHHREISDQGDGFAADDYVMTRDL